jgi:hypothetical protein
MVQINTDIIDTLVKETHKYSGIHEDSYMQFYTNIQMAREYRSHIHQAHAFLHTAIRHLNELPLYMSPIDPDVQEEVAELGQKIAVSFERILIEEAMNQNTYFKPKYI